MSHFKRLLGITAALITAGSVTAHAAEPSAIKYYVLREYNQSAALYEEGNPAPIVIYSTPLTSLNAADAELIKEGIRLRGMNEVSRLIEDLDIE